MGERFARSDPRYKAQHARDRAAGIRRYVEAGPAMAHVESLMSTGVSCADVSRAAGISKTTVQNLRRGKYAHMQRHVADAIMRVTPEQVLAGAATRSGAGALRRVQALLAMGHTHEKISKLGGFYSPSITQFRPRRVTTPVYEAVCRVYDAMWSVPGESEHGARLAAMHGHLPPLAWDDDTIDDPRQTPDLGLPTPKGFDLGDAAMLAETGETSYSAAARLGVTRDAMLRRFERTGRADLARWFAINDRASGVSAA